MVILFLRSPCEPNSLGQLKIREECHAIAYGFYVGINIRSESSLNLSYLVFSQMNSPSLHA